MMFYLKLPVKIDIIKHKQELDSKSTAIHATLLAPDDCQLFTFPDIPSYSAETVSICEINVLMYLLVLILQYMYCSTS